MNAETIRAIRAYYGWSQRELAEKLGVSKSCIAKVETSINPVTPTFRAKVAARIQLPPDLVQIVEQSKALASL